MNVFNIKGKHHPFVLSDSVDISGISKTRKKMKKERPFNPCTFFSSHANCHIPGNTGNSISKGKDSCLDRSLCPSHGQRKIPYCSMKFKRQM